MTATIVYSHAGDDRVLGLARKYGYVCEHSLHAYACLSVHMPRPCSARKDQKKNGAFPNHTSLPQSTGIPTAKYWTIEGPVSRPTGEGKYHW